MYKGEYKGDSPGKKVSRLKVWMQLRCIHRFLNLPYHGSLVLGGHGGDIETLKGLNFEPESINAIDLDPFLTDWCAHEHPEVNAICGEAGEVSKGIRYNMAHIDFCGSLSIDNVRTVLDIVANSWTMPTVLAVTMLKGREYLGGSSASLLEGISRSTRREMYGVAKKLKSPIGSKLFAGLNCTCDAFRKQNQPLIPGTACASCGSKLGYFDPKAMVEIAEKVIEERLQKGIGPGSDSGGLFGTDELRIVEKPKDEGAWIRQGYLRKNGTLGLVGTAISRGIALQRIIDWLLWARGLEWAKTQGSPRGLGGINSFGAFGLRLLGTCAYHSREKGQKKGGTPFMTAFYLVRLKTQDLGIMSTLANYQYSGRSSNSPLCFHTGMDTRASMNSLEPTAAELAKVLPNATVAKMLAVDPRSIGPWKAHHSRGTYAYPPAFSFPPGVDSIDPFVRCDPHNPTGVMEHPACKNKVGWDELQLRPWNLLET